jgi:hypothetical protein
MERERRGHPADTATSGLKKKQPLFREAVSRNNPGSDLLSHPVSRAVPSALEVLTAVFGMGTGVAPPLSPPGNYTIVRGGRAPNGSPTLEQCDASYECLLPHKLPLGRRRKQFFEEGYFIAKLRSRNRDFSLVFCRLGFPQQII